MNVPEIKLRIVNNTGRGIVPIVQTKARDGVKYFARGESTHMQRTMTDVKKVVLGLNSGPYNMDARLFARARETMTGDELSNYIENITVYDGSGALFMQGSDWINANCLSLLPVMSKYSHLMFVITITEELKLAGLEKYKNTEKIENIAHNKQFWGDFSYE